MIAERGSAQVWAKPLAGGQVAVALLNRGTQPLNIATTASQVGLLAARSYEVRDLWAHETTASAGDIGALVAPDSLVLYRVAPAG
jgi:alpha-galactosidase